MTRTDARSTPDASDLCTACGLCCDGTLFQRMPIVPAELPLAERAGAPVERDGNSLSAPQPCTFLQARRCTVYAERYAVCRAYRCRLLREVADGTLAPAVALDRVVEARRLRDAAQAAASEAGAPDWSFASRARAADWRAGADPADRRALAIAHLAILALDAFLLRHFRKPRQGGAPAGDQAASASNP